VGPRAGLDGCGKSWPPPGFDLWTIQPITSSYADYAITVPIPPSRGGVSINVQNDYHQPVRSRGGNSYARGRRRCRSASPRALVCRLDWG
jgi:hypothetical protein